MLGRTYLFARHAQALHQRVTLRAETYPEGADWPLSRTGEAQARELGRAFAGAACERVVSSTLRRARETAEIASAATGIPYRDAWPELNEIAPRTLHRRARARARPEWCDGIAGAWHLHRHLRGRDCEALDVASVERRIRGVLARLDALAERRIAIVSHGYLIFLIALVIPGVLRPALIRNCSITRVRADGRGRYRLDSFAERAVTRPGAR